MQDNPAASATKELKAAARDALRLGSQWAHTAIQWVDERRTEMTNRNREHETRERERAQRNRYSTSGYGSDEGDHGPGQPGQDASNLSGGRGYTGQSGPGRGDRDRDIQGHYSQGEYSAWRQDFQGGARETSQRGYGREGSVPQSMPPDDFSQRGEYGSQGPSGGGRQWQPGMQGSQGQASQYQRAQAYGSQGHGSHDDDRMRNHDTQRAGEYDQRAMSGQPYGYSDQQDQSFGPRPYARQSYGSGADPNQARTTGLGGQSYGGQDFEDRASFGSQGDMQGWMGQSLGHRGKGPKNYSRSDERIREDLNEKLTESDEIDASGISVEVNNGIATLSGVVEQRWMKHRAEDLAESCSGVRDVTNQITVKPQSSSRGMPSGSQSQPGEKVSTGSMQGSTASGSSGRPGSGSGSTAP